MTLLKQTHSSCEMNFTEVNRKDRGKVLKRLYLSHKFLVIPWDKRQTMITNIISLKVFHVFSAIFYYFENFNTSMVFIQVNCFPLPINPQRVIERIKINYVNRHFPVSVLNFVSFTFFQKQNNIQSELIKLYLQ